MIVPLFKSLLLLSFSLLSASGTPTFRSEEFPMPKQRGNEALLKESFEQYRTAVLNAGVKPPLHYDQFAFFFDNSYGLTLEEFKNTLICEYTFGGEIRQSNYSQDDRSGTADYILTDSYGGSSISDPQSSNFDPYICPASSFRRFPSYESFDFSEIQDGDIILETNAPDFGMGHAAIVYDAQKLYYQQNGGLSTFIQTIEAVPGGVQFGYLDAERINEYGVMILRPVNADLYVDDCLAFVYAQLGKTYDYPINSGRMNTSINSNQWYCSELIYAGYYYAGFTFNHSTYGWINPYDLLWSSFVLPTCFSETPDPVLISKNGNSWSFKVYNTTGSDRTLYYNSKLCFLADGMAWNNLHDITTINNVPNNLYYYVGVTTNWFAGAAAFFLLWERRKENNLLQRTQRSNKAF